MKETFGGFFGIPNPASSCLLDRPTGLVGTHASVVSFQDIVKMCSVPQLENEESTLAPHDRLRLCYLRTDLRCTV